MGKLVVLIAFFITNTVVYAQVLNDECATAQLLTPSLICNPVSGTLLNATTSINSFGCYGNSDVFYKFTAIATAASVTVKGSSGIDAVVGVYSSCGSNQIACVDATYYGGTEIVNLTGLTIGSMYYIKVQDFSSSPPSTYPFSICVQSENSIPQNDNCANPVQLIPSPTCNPVSGTLLGAGNSSISGSCSGNNDVFYLFEASAETATVVVAPSSGLDVVVGVFESCNGTKLACMDDQYAGGTENMALSGLTNGKTYLIQIQSFGSTLPSTPTFTVCVIGDTPPIPLNDACADAIEIIPVTAYTPITGTVRSATTSTTTASCSGNSDVFYKFTAVAKTATITVVGSVGLDPVIGLFSACGTSYMDCADFDYNTGGTEVLTPVNLTIGSTYYIKVQDYSTTLPTTSAFTIAVQSTAVTTDTDAAAALQQIGLFPNPTQDILNVEYVQMETSIEFIDLRGNVLLVKNISSDAHLDLSGFAAGVYILKLSVNGTVEHRRVVLSR